MLAYRKIQELPQPPTPGAAVGEALCLACFKALYLACLKVLYLVCLKAHTSYIFRLCIYSGDTLPLAIRLAGLGF